MKKVPLWVRILLYWVVTLAFTAAFSVLQEAADIRPEYIQMAQFGPALAGLIFLLLEGDSIADLLRRGLRLELDKFTLVAIITPVALGVVVYVLSRFLLGAYKPISAPGLMDALMVLSTILAALCEQIGWRGYVLPRLQARLTPLKTSLVLAVLWSVWHVPNLFRGVGFFSVWFVGVFGLTIVFNIVFNRTGGNLWAVTLMHASVNVAAYFLLDILDMRVLLLVSASYMLWAVGFMALEQRATKAMAG